ncbi:AAA family ATPase [Endozoicomonas sp.]|uniref:AAA family ATPase n=1 Tax=Endozoicomonas sp. TaxID=1892382 RepID=UPI003AF6A919
MLLLDGDWRYGSQATLNDCRPEHDLRNLLARLDMDQTALSSYRTEVGPYLALLGMSPEHLGTSSSGKSTDRILVQLLRHIRQKPGITLADIPSRNDDYLTSMIADADHLVLVLKPEIDGIRRARLLLDEAMTVLGLEQVTVVVNGSSRYTTISQAVIKQSLGLEPVMIPEDQRAVIPALEEGRLPMDSDPRSPFSRSLKPLMARLQPAPAVEPGSLFRLREWSHVFRSVH